MTPEARLRSVVIVVLVFAAGFAAGRLLDNNSGPAPAPAPAAPPLLRLVPDVRQSTTYSCGAAALQAVLCAWGIDSRERTLMDECGTTESAGTSPEAIAAAARARGLNVRLVEETDLVALQAAAERGVPAIVAIQAWADERPADFSWRDDWEDGHYVIVLGIDDRNVYVEDPSLLGTRGVIPRPDFLDRWHDYTGEPPFDATDRAWHRLAIFIEGGRPAAAPPLYSPVE
jgi:hypothetical protein